MKKPNLPNKLTLLRLVLVPVFVVVMLVSNELWASITGLCLFIVASLTDMLDGKIARKYNLITDFGKFLDPLADKFMVIGAGLVILYKSLVGGAPKLFCILFFCAMLVVVFRELAVTAMRLVVSSSANVVVAANMLGKIKTCTQIACIIVCIVEPSLYSLIPGCEKVAAILPASIATTALMTIFTLLSGINYLRSYWKYLDPEK